MPDMIIRGKVLRSGTLPSVTDFAWMTPLYCTKLPPGRHRLTVELDPDNRLKEPLPQLANNIKVFELDVKELYSFKLVSLEVNPNPPDPLLSTTAAPPGQRNRFRMVVKNTGQERVQLEWDFNAVDADAVPGAGGCTFDENGKQTRGKTGIIEPGGTAIIEHEWLIINMWQKKRLRLEGTIDYANRLCEPPGRRADNKITLFVPLKAEEEEGTAPPDRPSDPDIIDPNPGGGRHRK